MLAPDREHSRLIWEIASSTLAGDDLVACCHAATRFLHPSSGSDAAHAILAEILLRQVARERCEIASWLREP